MPSPWSALTEPEAFVVMDLLREFKQPDRHCVATEHFVCILTAGPGPDAEPVERTDLVARLRRDLARAQGARARPGEGVPCRPGGPANDGAEPATPGLAPNLRGGGAVVKPEEPGEATAPAEQDLPTLISCTSWSGRGRLCRYVWADGTVEWFTENMVHQKGRGLAARPA